MFPQEICDYQPVDIRSTYITYFRMIEIGWMLLFDTIDDKYVSPNVESVYWALTDNAGIMCAHSGGPALSWPPYPSETSVYFSLLRTPNCEK